MEEQSRVDEFDVLFDETDHWEHPPSEWDDPEAQMSQRQFFDVVESCLDKLPPNTGRVSMMREVMELESAEICKELAITSTNLG